MSEVRLSHPPRHLIFSFEDDFTGIGKAGPQTKLGRGLSVACLHAAVILFIAYIHRYNRRQGPIRVESRLPLPTGDVHSCKTTLSSAMDATPSTTMTSASAFVGGADLVGRDKDPHGLPIGSLTAAPHSWHCRQQSCVVASPLATPAEQPCRTAKFPHVCPIASTLLDGTTALISLCAGPGRSIGQHFCTPTILAWALATPSVSLPSLLLEVRVHELPGPDEVGTAVPATLAYCKRMIWQPTRPTDRVDLMLCPLHCDHNPASWWIPSKPVLLANVRLRPRRGRVRFAENYHRLKFLQAVRLLYQGAAWRPIAARSRGFLSHAVTSPRAMRSPICTTRSSPRH